MSALQSALPRKNDGSVGPVLSVIVPMFNEAQNVEAFFARLLPVLDGLHLDYEVICVDDGSTDATRARLVELRGPHPQIKIIGMSRNFGKEIAVTAGLHRSAGEACIPIDADLQHPPELIPALIAKWRDGFDVVFAVRRSRRNQGPVENVLARSFYWLFKYLSNIQMPAGAGDFRLLDRRVVEVLNTMPERARFMKGIFTWVGFRQVGVPFETEPRARGASGWSLRRRLHFAIDGITAFSTFPLTASAYVGAVIAIISLSLGLYFAIKTLVLGVDVPGYASIIVAVLFLGGVQLFTLGIIGSYLGRVFEEVKRRPLYVVDEAHGFAAETTRRTAASADRSV
ncbi:MAG: glycosyltransferase family 2 protein [Proteobacteria bacterium]|nr:glycosyltransferase family 2 protein [Pseudomonadota bacterium]